VSGGCGRYHPSCGRRGQPWSARHITLLAAAAFLFTTSPSSEADDSERFGLEAARVQASAVTHLRRKMRPRHRALQVLLGRMQSLYTHMKQRFHSDDHARMIVLVRAVSTILCTVRCCFCCRAQHAYSWQTSKSSNQVYFFAATLTICSYEIGIVTEGKYNIAHVCGLNKSSVYVWHANSSAGKEHSVCKYV
jgi:hypothetical protein